MKTRVGIHLPGNSRAAKPAFAMAAPAYPPTSAWEDDVGNPCHHVMRSHTIAPARPARITFASTTARSTNPRPIVRATAVPNRNTARKLKAAAQTTAALGESTRVETTVAMEFAASWKDRKSVV